MSFFERLSFRATLPLLFAVVGGLVGAFLPGALGDTPTYLSWLALVALPIGAWLGARRIEGLPVRWLLAVPAIWSLALVWSVPDIMRVVSRPLGGLCVLYGLYFAGLGLGRAAGARRPLWAWSGTVLLALSALPFAFSLGAEGAWPETQARLARASVECSPVGWVLECSGWDWSHTDRDLYARSGVEFAPRHPHRVRRTGALVLVLGAALALVSFRRSALRVDA